MARKVFIVEDDKFLMDAYKEKLVRQGYEIDTALDGEEALKKIPEFQPDLIILDLVLPKQDGLQVLEKLKSNPSTSQFPVVIASNLDRRDAKERANELGCVDYLTKSDISLEKLIEVCESHTSE